MVTKHQLAEQLHLALGAAIPDFRVHLRELILAVGQVRDQLLVATYERRLAQGKAEIPAEWVSAFEAVPVEYDTVRKREFVRLPVEPLALPGDVGLFSIAPMADEFNPYVPTRPGALGLLAHHPAFLLGGRVGYWREMGTEDQPGRALFKDAVKTESPTVLLKLVCPAVSIADRAPFPISGDMQPLIFDAVRQRYLPKPAPDKTPNHKDEPG